MLGVPFVMQLNPFGISTYLKKLVGLGTSGEWLGFWGSYLGSIITVLFSYFSIMYETKKETENAKYKLARESDKEKINLVRSRVILSKKGITYFRYNAEFLKKFKKHYEKNGKYRELLSLCGELIEDMDAAYNWYDKISDNVLTSIYEKPKIVEENSNEVLYITKRCLIIKADANRIKNLIETTGISNVLLYEKEVESAYDELVKLYQEAIDTSLSYTNSVCKYYMGIIENYRKEYFN